MTMSLGLQKVPNYLERSNFPKWHYAMLNDVARNEAIEKSIRETKPNGKIVFEIGAGTGIVALAFAKHGAKKVYTCEADPYMYEIAKTVINRSEYRGKIKLLYGMSTEVLIPIAKHKTPDIIFSETLDCGVIGEGLAKISKDVAKLSTSSTIVMPRIVKQMGMMVSSKNIYQLNNVESAMGFDVTPLNKHKTKTYYPVRSELHEHFNLSKPQTLRTYTLRDELASHQFELQANNDGICHGILSWFEVDFGGHKVTTKAHSGSHWHQAFHPFHGLLKVQKNRVYKFAIKEDGEITNIR